MATEHPTSEHLVLQNLIWISQKQTESDAACAKSQTPKVRRYPVLTKQIII